MKHRIHSLALSDETSTALTELVAERERAEILLKLVCPHTELSIDKDGLTSSNYADLYKEAEAQGIYSQGAANWEAFQAAILKRYDGTSGYVARANIVIAHATSLIRKNRKAAGAVVKVNTSRVADALLVLGLTTLQERIDNSANGQEPDAGKVENELPHAVGRQASSPRTIRRRK
jgi:hypothetical protein